MAPLSINSIDLPTKGKLNVKMDNIEINLERTLNDMMNDVDEFELQLEFLDSKEIDFKYYREERSANRTVEELDLDIEYFDGMEINVKVHY